MTTGTTTTDGTTTTATTTTAGGVAKQQQQEEYEKQRVRQDAAAKLKQRQQELHAQLDSNTGQHVSELLVGGEVPRDGKHGDGSRVENKEGGNTHDGHHIPENVHHDTPTTTTTTGGGGNGGGGSGGGTTTGSTGAGGVLNKVGGVDVVTHVVDEVHHESVDPVTAPPLDPTIMGNGDAGVNGAVRAVQGGGNGGHGGDSDGEGNKKGKQEHPATQILMGKCARMQGLSSAQVRGSVSCGDVSCGDVCCGGVCCGGVCCGGVCCGGVSCDGVCCGDVLYTRGAHTKACRWLVRSDHHAVSMLFPTSSSHPPTTHAYPFFHDTHTHTHS